MSTPTRTLLASALLIAAAAASAGAQPGRSPTPVLTLSAEDHALLADGEISDAQHVGGGLASLFVGFGVGQAIEGRWSDAGWIFAVGETASVAAIMIGVAKIAACVDDDRCDDRGGRRLGVAGLFGLLVFRGAGIIDAIVAPPRHNRRVRALRARLGAPQPSAPWGPWVAPPSSGSGVVGGVSIRF